MLVPKKNISRKDMDGKGQLTKKWGCTVYPVRRHQSLPRGCLEHSGPLQTEKWHPADSSFPTRESVGWGWGKLAGGQSKESGIPFGNTLR